MKKTIFLNLTVTLSSAVCCAQTANHSENIASDFEHALAMVPEHAQWPSGIMYYDMEDAANVFIARYNDTSTVEFLGAKIEEPNSRKLASLSLAKLAPTNEAAEKALCRQVYGTRWIIRRDALIAIAYLDPNDGRRIAETLLTQPGPWDVRKLTIAMLVGLGNQNTLEMFKQMQPDEESLIVKNALESAIPELEYRLIQVPPDKQAGWARQETLSWRTLMESPLSRAPGTEKYLAAKTLQLQGYQFSRAYLEYKLNIEDILSVEIIGEQKEVWAVESLKKYACDKGALGDSARGALVEIGTNEALRALEDSLVPGLPSSVFNHVMSLLRLYGDEASAQFADRLSSDQRFSDSERNSLRITHDVVRKRFAQKSWQQCGSGAAWNLSPAYRGETVATRPVLSWSPGNYAVTHDVYFGTDFHDVIDATTSSNAYKGSQPLDANSFSPGPLQSGQTYFWRIDEVNDANAKSPWESEVFRFTVVDYIPAGCISVTASTQYWFAVNTINGSGLCRSDGQWLHTNSPNAEDMWLTAEFTTTVSAATEIGPVWIKYELDRIYKLGTMSVWNYNQYSPAFPGLTGRGLRNVTVEYSADGTDYTKLGEYEFAQATGTDTYAHNTEVDFGGVEVRCVLITADANNGNWAGPCGERYGLSEVRFHEFNHIPVADPGPDQALYAGADDSAEVTLDGSASYDEDGHTLTYRWTWKVDDQRTTLAGGDDMVDWLDFAAFAEQWLRAGNSFGDIAPTGGDGVVNPLDLATLTEAWLTAPTSPYWNPQCDIAPTGAVITIKLPAGEHIIELIVTDGIDNSLPDDVVITIIEPTKSLL